MSQPSAQSCLPFAGDESSQHAAHAEVTQSDEILWAVRCEKLAVKARYSREGEKVVSRQSQGSVGLWKLIRRLPRV